MSVGPAVAAVAVAVALTAALAGCTSVGCDAMGSADFFSVVATSTSAPHPDLRVCIASDCSPTIADVRGASGEIRSGAQRRARVVATSLDHWKVVVEPETSDPAAVTISVGPAAAPVAVRAVALTWHRSPSSTVCSSWQTVDPVRITAP